jgi:hypothetical protein
MGWNGMERMRWDAASEVGACTIGEHEFVGLKGMDRERRDHVARQVDTQRLEELGTAQEGRESLVAVLPRALLQRRRQLRMRQLDDLKVFAVQHRALHNVGGGDDVRRSWPSMHDRQVAKELTRHQLAHDVNAVSVQRRHADDARALDDEIEAGGTLAHREDTVVAREIELEARVDDGLHELW